MYLVEIKTPPGPGDSSRPWVLAWAGVVDDYRPIFAAYVGNWSALLSAAWLELEGGAA